MEKRYRNKIIIISIQHCPTRSHRTSPGWPGGKAPASRPAGLGSVPAFAEDLFLGRVLLALQWLPCWVPGVTGSALGLVGPVSVYRAWVK